MQQHALRHAVKRRAVESWLPLVFGFCVALLVGTTWVGTHRSIAAAGYSPGSGDPWPPSRAARLAQAAGAADAAAATVAVAPAPGSAEAAATVTTGSTLEELLSALAAKHGVPSGGSGSALGSAAATAVAGGVGDHIELHAERVAAVLGRAKAAESLARLQSAPGGDVAAAQDSAGRHQDLYHRGAGGLLLGPLEGAESAACPLGVAPPRGGQTATALVVIAGAGSAAQLGPALRELLVALGRAGDDARAAFHAFVAVDGADPLVKQVAVHYAAEAMGALRVIHHGRNATAAAAAPADDDNCSNDPGRPGHQVFLLRLLLECLGYPAVLTVGPESRLAPDAPAFFSSLQWLLGSDRSLFCIAGGTAVSAAQAAADPDLLLRSDAPPAPAAGWLVPARVGREVLAQWRAAVAHGTAPRAYDDSTAGWLQFLTVPGLRQGRQCLLPDLPRVWAANSSSGVVAAAAADGTSSGGGSAPRVPTPAELARRANATFGGAGSAEEGGASALPGGLSGIQWGEEDLSWLMEPGYSRLVMEKLRAALPSSPAAAADAPAGSTPRYVLFEGEEGYKAAMAALGLPTTVGPAADRAHCFSVPAGSGTGASWGREHCQAFFPPLSYHGIVPTYNARGVRIFLVPSVYSAALGGTGSSGAGGGSTSGSSGSTSGAGRKTAAPSAAGDPAAAAVSRGGGVLSSGGTVIHSSSIAGEEDADGSGGGLPAVEGLDSYATYLAELMEQEAGPRKVGAAGEAAVAAAGSGAGRPQRCRRSDETRAV